ncbi:hypothetical protein CUZ91_0228 [Enterococcus xinjiangensis]|nr:hypothetical protein [Enterococcus lactis]
MISDRSIGSPKRTVTLLRLNKSPSVSGPWYTAGTIFALDILEINAIPPLSSVACLVPLGNMIKLKFVDFKIFTGVLMTLGPGFSLLTGKALDRVNINRRTGFLNSSSFAIKLNSFGAAATARYNGSHQVRWGATSM